MAEDNDVDAPIGVDAPLRYYNGTPRIITCLSEEERKQMLREIMERSRLPQTYLTRQDTKPPVQPIRPELVALLDALLFPSSDKTVRDMNALAIAVLTGDRAAALALADLVKETWEAEAKPSAVEAAPV